MNLGAGRRISARNTLFYKRVFPLLWIGTAALIVGLAVATGQRGHSVRLTALLIPAFAFGLGWFMLRRLVSDLADEVWDEGDALRVRFGHDEERIALADIVNIGYTMMINPARVTLTLRNPGRFGKEVSFSPVRQGFLAPLLRSNPLVSDLIERVDAARRR